MGQRALLPFRRKEGRKEGLLRISSPWKIWRLRPGLNPRTWVPKASTLHPDHRRRFTCVHILTSHIKNYKLIYEEYTFSNVLVWCVALRQNSNKADDVRRRYIDDFSWIICCHGKAITVTYSESVFVLLVILLAIRIRHVVTCGLTNLPYFFHIVAYRYWS